MWTKNGLELHFFDLQALEDTLNKIIDKREGEVKLQTPQDITPEKQPKRQYGNMDFFSRWGIELLSSPFPLSYGLFAKEKDYLTGKLVVDIGGDNHIGRYEKLSLHLLHGFSSADGYTPLCKIEMVGVADSQTPVNYGARKDFVKKFGIWIKADVSDVFSDDIFGMEGK